DPLVAFGTQDRPRPVGRVVLAQGARAAGVGHEYPYRTHVDPVAPTVGGRVLVRPPRELVDHVAGLTLALAHPVPPRVLLPLLGREVAQVLVHPVGAQAVGDTFGPPGHFVHRAPPGG